jgi:hypothetical protein
MNGYIIGIVIIIVVNLLVALGVWAYHLQKDRRKGILLALVVFFTPIFSEAYFLIVLLFKQILKAFNVDDVDVSDLGAKEKIKVIEAANYEVDKNKVPLEESLIISDKADRRAAFLEILKAGVTESIDIVRKAVEDSDTEISHYAAAFLLEEITKFKKKEKELSEICENAGKIEAYYNYLDYSGEFLGHNIMMQEEQRRYANLFDQKLLDFNSSERKSL